MKANQECKCKECIKLCEKNPGWMTPEEAEQAIQKGLAKRLMRDWLEPCREVDNKERIYLLAPASIGCECRDAPEMPEPEDFSFGSWSMMKHFCKGRCNFLIDNLCEIHDSGFKPVQCREALGCKTLEKLENDNYVVAKLWDNIKAKELLKKWQKLVKE